MSFAHGPEFDPATMPASSLGSAQSIWYRRPWFLVTLAVLVVVAVSVLTDLPTPMSVAQDASAQNAGMSEINSDLRPCVYAINEAFSFYHQDIHGQLTAANKKQVSHLLVDDQAACSFTSNEVYDLTNNLQLDLTAAGKDINAATPLIDTWITFDANNAIVDIRHLYTNHQNAAALADLAVRLQHLALEQRGAQGDVAAANSLLGGRLHALKMPTLPPLASIIH